MQDIDSAVSGPLLQPLYALKVELESAFYRGQGHKIIGRSLRQLEDYALNHAQGAPRQLSPASPPVERLYRQFIRQIEEWLTEYRDGAHILTAELLFFIQQWLHDHQRLAAAPLVTPPAAAASTPAG